MSEAPPPEITLDTRFGTFDVGPHEIINFPEGLPGFEASRRFVLLSSDAFAPLQCLHAVDGELPSFLALDPSIVLPAYRSAFDVADYKRLDAVGPEQLVWLAFVALEGDGVAPTVNLRAPVVINPERMIGVQLVSADQAHSVRHTLAA